MFIPFSIFAVGGFHKKWEVLTLMTTNGTKHCLGVNGYWWSTDVSKADIWLTDLVSWAAAFFTPWDNVACTVTACQREFSCSIENSSSRPTRCSRTSGEQPLRAKRSFFRALHS